MSQSRKIAIALGERPHPFISSFQLGRIIFDLLVPREALPSPVAEENLPLSEQKIYARTVSKLKKSGILVPNPFVRPDHGYDILGNTSTRPELIACELDPFCAVSHLSAMVIYGWSDHLPQTLFLTSLKPTQWRLQAAEFMSKSLGQQKERYFSLGFPGLIRSRPNKIKKINLVWKETENRVEFKQMEPGFRLTSIGRTFYDSLKSPELCGGIYPVIQVWEEHAKTNLDSILNYFEVHGKEIDRARAGYLLDEVCGISHETIDKWKQAVQRGGSRKMLPNSPYSNQYSKNWSISLNHL